MKRRSLRAPFLRPYPSRKVNLFVTFPATSLITCVKMKEMTIGPVRRWLHVNKLPYLAILVYLGVLFRNITDLYAYTDVYEFMLNSGNPHFIDVFLQGGRVLYGLMNKLLFTTFNTVETVKYVRLLSLAGVACMALTLYRMLSHYSLRPLPALTTVLLFVSSPSIGIITAWAATHQVGWGIAFALLAGQLVTENRGSKLHIALGIVLGVISLNLYQSAYTAFIIPVFLRWLQSNKNQEVIVWPLIYHALTYAVYYAAFKLCLDHLFKLPPLERAGISSDMIHNLDALIDGPLTYALGYSFLFVRDELLVDIRWVTGLMIALVYLRWDLVPQLRRPEKLRPGHVIMPLLVFFLLSMLPSFMSVDKWVSYRSMPTLMLLVAIHIVLALQRITFDWKWLSIPVNIAVIVTAFILANDNVNRGLIRNLVDEYAAMQAVVNDLPADTKVINVVPPELDILVRNGLMQRIVSDEFGRLANSSDWVPVPFFKLLLRDRQMEDVNIKVHRPGTVADSLPGVFIDMEREYLRYIGHERY